MALAATSAGLQRIIDAVRAHTLKYGWTLNFNKTLVLVFGSEQLRTEQEGVRFFWGDAELRRAAAVKCLGIHFSDDMSWATHIAEAARKGWSSYHAWAPVLASSRIHVATKKRLIDIVFGWLWSIASNCGVPLLCPRTRHHCKALLWCWRRRAASPAAYKQRQPSMHGNDVRA